MRNTKTEYKNVYLKDTARTGKPCVGYFYYDKMINGQVWSSSGSNSFKTAKDAAIALDKKLIENGFEPINVLKRKI